MPGRTFDTVTMSLTTRDIELSIPWVRLSTWQTNTMAELLDPDGKTLTVLSKDATAGSAFSYGLCGYELNTGWSPYCGSFPEDSSVKWEPIGVNEGRIDQAVRVTFDQLDSNWGTSTLYQANLWI